MTKMDVFGLMLIILCLKVTSGDEAAIPGELEDSNKGSLEPPIDDEVTTAAEPHDACSGDDAFMRDDRQDEPIFSPTDPNQVHEPVIEQYHVTSTVAARYVSTSVVARVVNRASISQELPLRFKANDEAFISSFVMVVDGVPYNAEVRKRVEAQKSYKKAKQEGRDALHLKQKNELSTCYLIDINLAAHSNVSFNLTYQELLHRNEGRYSHQIKVAIGQIVDDFRVEVKIFEPQGIKFLNSTWIQDGQAGILEPTVSFQPPTTRGIVVLTPSRSLQSDVAVSDEGLDGFLEVIYDVNHDFNGGAIQVVNGYFVHYFSPEGLPPAPKKIIFAIDVSSSMSGQKLQQTKEVLSAIFDQLRENDTFNVLAFSDTVKYFNPAAVPATPENIDEAQSFVSNLKATGGANIYESLFAAIRQFNDTEEAFQAILFLTDGRGSSSTVRLPDMVKNKTDNKIALYTIGFGLDVDAALLEQLAAENMGRYRQILVGPNAGLQMQGFFEEFATPLLYNLDFHYEDNAVNISSLTGATISNYFDGKELIVAGKISEEYKGNDLRAVVTARRQDRLQLTTTTNIGRVDRNMIADFTERLWAFMTIKDLLAREKVARTEEEKEALNQEALDLSLRYAFVTPVTSLLVVNPEAVVNPTIPPDDEDQDGSETDGGVAGDPHVVIQDSVSNLRVCFDIHGPNGTVVNLLDDINIGITVNGEMIEIDTNRTRYKPNKSKPTYFRRIAVRVADDWIVATCETITLKGEEPIYWSNVTDVDVGSCKLTIENGTTATIACPRGIVMEVSRQTTLGYLEHLDFHLDQGGSFSSCVDGIVGQFQRRQMITMESTRRTAKKSGKEWVKLQLDGETEVSVHKVNRRRTGICWFIYGGPDLPILERSYLKYILMELYDKPDYAPETNEDVMLKQLTG